ncbi:hypothetical protein MMC13_005022 [Lambiella insularis]|nr:hypothetical protein [Lambiella insularis]
MKDSGMRRRVFFCVVSGTVLAVTLIVFLALAMSNSVAGEEFHIVLILFLLFFAVFFCHSLIRLCMLALKKKERGSTRITTDEMSSVGFAHPAEPIRVVLARDEELGIGDELADGVKDLPSPPPAYGLWRGSVRIDPNLLRWQRAEAVPHLPVFAQWSSVNRPPSYMSDDGMERIRE